MAKHSIRYRIAKCALSKSCPKCASIGDPIVVNGGTHYTLYCPSCGAHIKHASVDDKRHFYASQAKVEDGTPIKVCSHYINSEKTMLR